MPPSILSVRGPERVRPNFLAEFVADLGPGWSAPQRAQISWRVELDGQVVDIREDVGPLLRIAVPAVAAGRIGRVFPFHAILGSGPSWEGVVDDEALEVAAAPLAPVTVETRREGRKWLARVDGDPEFVVGQEFRNGSRLGLFNSADPVGPFYRGTDWEGELGLWARMLEPTAVAEGEGNMVALNTWDSARFTFGFAQFAAHTPNENLVLLLRKLLELPRAAHYFPELSLVNSRIHHTTRGALESATSTAALQSFLNPDSAAIDPMDEVGAAARLMHWTRADPEARRVQVTSAVEKMRSYFIRRAADLNGKLDILCFLVWDIAHQGRARSYANQVRPALQAADPEAALLTIGEDRFPGRITTLRREINRLRTAGVLGRHRYDTASRELVRV